MLFVFSNNLVSTDMSEHELRVHSGFAKSRNVSADTKNWKITELFVSFLHINNLYRYWKYAAKAGLMRSQTSAQDESCFIDDGNRFNKV